MFNIEKLRSLYTASNQEKQKYSTRWGRTAALTGIVSPLAITASLNSGKSGTETLPIDEDIYDPTASQNVFTLSNYTFTMLFGNKQRFLIKADDKADQPYYDEVACGANALLDDPEASFASTARQVLETSDIPFGNGGFVIKVDEAREGLLFDAATCTDCSIIEGKNGKVVALALNQLVSPQAFTDSFGAMPKDMKDAIAKQKTATKDIQLVYMLMKNPDYDDKADKNAEASKEYCGVYFCADLATGWHHANYFDYPMFVFHRNIIMRGELYARGNIDRVLSSVDSVNELTRMANDSVERMENPAIGITAELTSDSVIDMSPGGVNVLTPMPGQNGTPMFSMQPAGDPSGILKTTMPRLDSAITQAFGLSMYLDIQPVAGMTAHQVVEGTISRNKNLLPTYLGYREQWLLPMYSLVTRITIDKKWFKSTRKAPQSKKYTIIPLTQMEEVYTSNVMDKLSEISNMFEALKNVMPMPQVMFMLYPMVKNALKGTKYEPYFVTEAKFAERIKANAEADAINNYMGGKGKGADGGADGSGLGSSIVGKNVKAAEGAK